MIVQDKVIVVTGVGPGLGSEVARIALRDGARVVIGSRREKKLAAAAGKLDPTGERVAYRATDITVVEQCDALMQTAVDRFGGVDALVQVAAFDALFGTLQTTSAEDWMKSMQANVVGNMQIARAAVPHLRGRGGGSIVLIGSQSMWLPPAMAQIAYAAAKGALVAAMKHMVTELGPDKIRVNMVVPTYMWGPPVQMFVDWQASERKVEKQVVIDEIAAKMPLGEIPADEDVAEACVFFCSDRSRMITGETLLVNAGEMMH
jgi:NAD(P)-dependent dehydrogenase (short-subunit alcohol dehydrogenase family)